MHLPFLGTAFLDCLASHDLPKLAHRVRAGLETSTLNKGENTSLKQGFSGQAKVGYRDFERVVNLHAYQDRPHFRQPPGDGITDCPA